MRRTTTKRRLNSLRISRPGGCHRPFLAVPNIVRKKFGSADHHGSESIETEPIPGVDQPKFRNVMSLGHGLLDDDTLAGLRDSRLVMMK
jgi:hypothetical protein